MPPAKRRAVQNYAKALNSAGVPFDVASVYVAHWFRSRGLPITLENMEAAFAACDD